MKYTLILFVSVLFCSPSISQSWTISKEQSIAIRGKRDIIPSKFIASRLDDDKMKEILWSAPAELRFNPETDEHTTIRIMLADGTIDKFSVIEYKMMEPELAAKYPDIKTFKGISQSNPYRKVRIDYTVHGFRAVVTDQSGQTYIDHYQRGDKSHKIIYRKKDYINLDDWACEFDSKNGHAHKEEEIAIQRFSGDCVFRSYRLSVTATGEYSNYHDANMESESGLVLSAVTTTVNRVNDVFEQDITTRFILIDNNEDIFYYDPATDPFNGSSSNAMIGQNQVNTDAVIGSANYDLGHIFSTGGSGLASLGVICSNGFKARGVTGISNPVNDPFDIDYVAHEIGHQLGANHTQNNSCNRNNATSMEPGSASTIMGYAGICSPNVQNNSDAYFHAISIQEMNAEITGNNCHEVIDFDNQAPVVNALANKSIPHSTPFVLEADAIDNDGDVLTYNWEQMDNEVGSMPPSETNTVGPMFRTLFATEDPKRYFPSIDIIVGSANDQWEVLPSVGRAMDFRVTVRDYTFLPGCTDETDVTITTVANAGPFVINSIDNTPWLESQTVTIQWDVANTDVAPITCDNVDILLSYDGGNTYPEVLASGVTNDGSADVVVPSGVSAIARVMVKCSDNVFFAINNSDFAININCYLISSTDVPVAISASGTPTVTSDLNVLESGQITDINLSGLVGTHSYISDLNFTLIAPDGSRQALWEDPCAFEDDFNINFDDEAANNNYPCPPTDGGTYIPDNPLSFFNGKEMEGLWVLEILDDAPGDGGELTGWSINVCADTPECVLTVDRRDYSSVEGSLLNALECAAPNSIITLDPSIPNKAISTEGQSILIDKNVTIMANRSDDIRLFCQSNDFGITIEAGVTLTLIGFDFENTNSNNGVIINNGNLIIEDMNISFTAGPSIVNNVGSTATTKGTCNIVEE